MPVHGGFPRRTKRRVLPPSTTASPPAEKNGKFFRRHDALSNRTGSPENPPLSLCASGRAVILLYFGHGQTRLLEATILIVANETPACVDLIAILFHHVSEAISGQVIVINGNLVP